MLFNSTRKFLISLKAMHYCMAFFIFIFYVHADAKVRIQQPNPDQKKVSEIKTVALRLLAKNSRAAAIKYLVNSEAISTSAEFQSGLGVIKENILSLFINQQSQDLYESSAAIMIQNTRLSEKNILHCLELESDNLYCRWQYLKILNYKNDPNFRSAANLFIADTDGFPFFGVLAMTLNLNTVPKNLSQIDIQKSHPILFYILDFERSLKVQNYSLSKEIIEKLTVLAPDYPDLLYMRSKLAELSSEVLLSTDDGLMLSIYRKKCATLTPMLTRKYFYDIHLCHRGL